MNRLAILLNGHFKHYSFLYKNFNEHLLEPFKFAGYDIHIYFSCWNELSNKDSFSSKHGNDFGATYKEFNLEDILDKYRPIDYFVGEYENYKHLFNILKYDPDLDLNLLDKDGHDGPYLFNLNQWFHRENVNWLKRKYEEKNSFKYDLVISMRPDIFFLIPFPIDRIDKNKVNFRMLFSDMFLLSDSETNDKIDSLFSNLQNIITKYGRNKIEWFNYIYLPEHFLECHLLDIGITKDKRKELGEDLGWLFPRSFSIETLYEICNKTNQLEKFQYVLDYFNIRY